MWLVVKEMNVGRRKRGERRKRRLRAWLRSGHMMPSGQQLNSQKTLTSGRRAVIKVF